METNINLIGGGQFWSGKMWWLSENLVIFLHR